MGARAHLNLIRRRCLSELGHLTQVKTPCASLRAGVRRRYCREVGMAVWMHEWLCVLDCRLSDPEVVVLGSTRLGSLRILYGGVEYRNE